MPDDGLGVFVCLLSVYFIRLAGEVAGRPLGQPA